jgi:hypothetical protein
MLVQGIERLVGIQKAQFSEFSLERIASGMNPRKQKWFTKMRQPTALIQYHQQK